MALARRVLDRFQAADGGLLAAGVAYNTVLAFIPIGLLATGFAGLVLNDAASRHDVVRAIAALFPPLAGVVDEIAVGLSQASPSLSLLGLVLAAWGTSRLFASLEAALALMDSAAPRRGLVRRAARRIGSIIVLAGIVVAALVITPTLAIAVEMSGTGPARPVLDALLTFVPPVLAGFALAAVYRLIPPVRPTWRAIRLPAVVCAVALVVLTRVFVFLAPRVFGANLVYGTLGAVLVGLTWLDLAYSVVLLGAAWVRERSTTMEASVA